MSHNLYHSKNKNNEAIPQGSENTLIITQLSHLRDMQNLRATIPNNPYHDQHIMEFTQCVEEAVTEIQFYYDGILLEQNEIIEELTRRVDRLEKMVAVKQSPFEVDIVATKDSLQKLKKAIMGVFR